MMGATFSLVSLARSLTANPLETNDENNNSRWAEAPCHTAPDVETRLKR